MTGPTIDSMLRDPARINAGLLDVAESRAVAEALFPRPAGPTRHRFVDTPGRTWLWSRDVVRRELGAQRALPARWRWFYRGAHVSGSITVGELERQARRERPVVPVEPILLGVHECRIYPMPQPPHIEAEIRAGRLVLSVADGEVLSVPMLQGPAAPDVVADEADTGPIIGFLPAAPACCGGGPQWGHTFDCPQCPD